MMLANLTPAECFTTATIPIGTHISNEIDTVNAKLVGIITPAAWDAAPLYLLLGTQTGLTSAWISNAAAGFFPLIPAANFVVSSYVLLSEGFNNYSFDNLPRYINLFSGVPGTVVNQTANRVFTLIFHPRQAPIG